jgi:hypothetical protein
MNSTQAATIKPGIDFTDLFLGALLKPIRAQLDSWDWLKWPYWNYVLYGIGFVIVVSILYWFWANWLR